MADGLARRAKSMAAQVTGRRMARCKCWGWPGACRHLGTLAGRQNDSGRCACSRPRNLSKSPRRAQGPEVSARGASQGWFNSPQERRISRVGRRPLCLILFLNAHTVEEWSAARDVPVRIDGLARHARGEVGCQERERRSQVGAALQEIVHAGDTRQRTATLAPTGTTEIRCKFMSGLVGQV